jgi:hypothetical protein
LLMIMLMMKGRKMETGEGGKVAWLGGCFSLPGLCDSCVI